MAKALLGHERTMIADVFGPGGRGRDVAAGNPLVELARDYIRRHELVIALRGPQGLGWEGEGFDAVELTQTREWLFSRAITIAGGTSEIQLNIIAKHVLALPD